VESEDVRDALWATGGLLPGLLGVLGRGVPPCLVGDVFLAALFQWLLFAAPSPPRPPRNRRSQIPNPKQQKQSPNPQTHNRNRNRRKPPPDEFESDEDNTESEWEPEYVGAGLGLKAEDPLNPQYSLRHSNHPLAPFPGEPLKWASYVYDDGTT
jgi:hypothetical protein